MSGGKGGSKTQETTIPDWIRGPAERNLQRAEAVQQIPYMPYYGPDVAAFTPAQNAAFQGNIGAAEAFGLLAPGTLTPTSGMPEPTEYAGGFTGYSSQPMYEQALAELKAKQPGAVAQYDALFGNAVPANNFGGGGGSRFRGSANQSNPARTREQIIADRYASTKVGEDASGNSLYGYTGQGQQSRAGTGATRLPTPYTGHPPQEAYRYMNPPSTAGQGLPWQIQGSSNTTGYGGNNRGLGK